MKYKGVVTIIIGCLLLAYCAYAEIYMPYIIMPFMVLLVGIALLPAKAGKRKGGTDTGAAEDVADAGSLFYKYFGRQTKRQDDDFDLFD